MLELHEIGERVIKEKLKNCKVERGEGWNKFANSIHHSHLQPAVIQMKKINDEKKAKVEHLTFIIIMTII